MNRLGWTPDLVIAAFIIVICSILMILGINSEVKSVFGLSAAWVFASAFTRKQESRRK
jgi:hypothetical protein